MNSNYRQLEKIYLVTLPREHEREIRQISLANQACRDRQNTLSNLLAALVSRMMQSALKLEKANERN